MGKQEIAKIFSVETSWKVMEVCEVCGLFVDETVSRLQNAVKSICDEDNGKFMQLQKRNLHLIYDNYFVIWQTCCISCVPFPACEYSSLHHFPSPDSGGLDLRKEQYIKK
jgi:hypothetical protein